MQKYPIKMITIGALLCAAWIGYSANSGSAPKAVAAAQVDNKSDESGVVSGVFFRNSNLNDELASKFKSSVNLIESGEHQTAIIQLNEIIKQQPQAIEPYINLAALYAKSNNIDQASVTLKKAIQVNENTSVLFESLQSLYAAQAALAYQRALEIDTVDDKALAVKLPTIKTLMVDQPNAADSLLQESNQKLSLKIAQNEQVLDSLRSKLSDADKENAALVSSNAQLKKEFQQQAQLIATQGDTQTQLVITLKRDIEQAKQKNIALEREHAQKIAALERESNKEIALLQSQFNQALAIASAQTSAGSQVVAAVEPAPVVVQAPLVKDDAPSETVAIELVQAWARSWAAQDVSSYIAFYEQGFRPSNGISNSKWREQRQVRLTNKSFIEVTVSNFKLKKRASQFEVTFLQHYKSNNVDDKIYKRLVFDKKGKDWPQAKIVAEQVVSG